MSKKRMIGYALIDLCASSAYAAARFDDYVNVIRKIESDYGEGITRQGVEKCSRKRRHKRQQRKGR